MAVHPIFQNVSPCSKFLKPLFLKNLGNLLVQKIDQLIKKLIRWDNRLGRARNSDIDSFIVNENDEWLIYNEDLKSFTDLPKKAQAYFETHKHELKERAAFQRGDCEWWKYTFPLSNHLYNKKRIICPYLATFNRFALIDSEKIMGLTDTSVIFESEQKENLLYILGLLNSRLLTFRFRSIGKMKGGGVLEYFWNSIKKIPIKRIDFNMSNEKSQHDKVVLLSTQIIQTKKDASKAKTDKDKQFTKNKYDSLINNLNSIVFDLYNINSEERDLIMRETDNLSKK
ncbi:hypothetical protein EBU94_06350 [bacterium]|nr:hypothetical protein [bacterium]